LRLRGCTVYVCVFASPVTVVGKPEEGVWLNVIVWEPSHFIFATLLPSAAGRGYVTAFITTIVMDQIDSKDALRFDIGPVKGADIITPKSTNLESRLNAR
jgi:hypothetical protein